MVEALPRAASGRTLLEVMTEAARIGGRIILERFRGAKEVTFKGRANVVTDVDVAAERAILALLRREGPDFGVMAEESGVVAGASPYTWVVDPLDGTRNYASAIPHCAVNIAVARGDEVVAGITYDPFRDELFSAQRGHGATLNGAPIRVSSRRRLAEGILGFDMGYADEKALWALRLVQHLWPGVQSIRVMGSSALGLAYAACGRLDLYFHHHLYPWDLAPGLVLAQEAGGAAAVRQGGPAGLHHDSIVVSSPHLLEEFLRATKGLEWRTR